MELVAVNRSFHQPVGLHSGPAPGSDFFTGPLDLEIGCGVGFHPLRHSKLQPERKIIAIEHTREKFEKFERRRLRHGSPPNLLAVHANAITWVHQFLPAECLDQVFLLYPNPNPHNSARRWIRMPFFGRLLDSVKTGGNLYVSTNIESYAKEVCHYAVQQWGLDVIEFRKFWAQDLVRSGQSAKTHFEKKYLERGECCYDLHLRKVSANRFYFTGDNVSGQSLNS